MAKATAKEVPGSESESELPKSAKKSTTASGNASNNKGHGADAEMEAEGSGSEEEGDEEEYEIEAILDAKQGTFPGGRVGYLVKWKGYGEEHNSWVDEKDAEGAKELIDDYWKRVGKKNGARKSDVKPKPPAKPRKSTAKDESDEESAQPAKKRGRPPKSQARATSEEMMEEDEENDAPKKKQRKSMGGGAKGAKRGAVTTEVLDDDDVYTDMKKWKDLSTWEHLVDTIDTVERTDNNELLVYFTLKNGKGQGRETSDICKKKIPYKLIEFYESNLRWKPTNEDAMEE